MKSIKSFLILILKALKKLENQFQKHPKKFYLFTFLFFCLAFLWTFRPLDSNEELAQSKQITKSRYTIVYSTNLLNVDLEKLKGKKFVFRPRLPQTELPPQMKDFQAMIPPQDLEHIVIQQRLGSMSLSKIKNRYQMIIKELIKKNNFFYSQEGYILNELKKEIEIAPQKADPTPF